MGIESGTSPIEGREFWISRIEKQAQLEEQPLSDIERRYINCSTLSDRQKVKALQAEFRKDHNDEEFIDRITGLIDRAYRNECARDSRVRARYKRELDALNTTDFYLWVYATLAMSHHFEPANTFSSRLLSAFMISAGVALILGVLFVIWHFIAPLLRH